MRKIKKEWSRASRTHNQAMTGPMSNLEFYTDEDGLVYALDTIPPQAVYNAEGHSIHYEDGDYDIEACIDLLKRGKTYYIKSVYRSRIIDQILRRQK